MSKVFKPQLFFCVDDGMAYLKTKSCNKWFFPMNKEDIDQLKKYFILTEIDLPEKMKGHHFYERECGCQEITDFIEKKQEEGEFWFGRDIFFTI